MSGEESAGGPGGKVAGIVAGALVEAAKDLPPMKVAGEKTAHALANVATTVEHLSSLLGLVNAPFAAARWVVKYTVEQFRGDMTKRLAAIPDEERIEPKLVIAGPVLEALRYAADEEPLRQMYLNLLAASADRRAAGWSHPAFVEIVKQISPMEAPLLAHVLYSPGRHPLVRARRRDRSSPMEQHVVLEYAVHLEYDPEEYQDMQQFDHRLTAAMITNWTRLGLVEARFDIQLQPHDRAYGWVDTQPEIQKAKFQSGELKIEYGALSTTPFGMRFAKAVGLSNVGDTWSPG